MTIVAKQDVGAILDQLEKSLYYCNQMLLNSDRLANYLPLGIGYPIELDAHITETARRILHEWKQIQLDYNFVMAHFSSEIVRGISYPVYITRYGIMTPETIFEAIQEQNDNLREIGGVQNIPDISLDDSERVHEAIQMIINGK